MSLDKSILHKVPDNDEEFRLDWVFPQAIGISRKGKETTERWTKEIFKYMDAISYEEKKDGFWYQFLHNVDNPVFKEVTKWVDEEVNKYAQQLKFPDKYICTESWCHDYPIYNSQPWHAHAGNMISAVFMIWGRPYTDSHLYFRNPAGEDMMNPYNITPKTNRDEMQKIFPINGFPQWGYPTMPGSLYIFRSYMQHSTNTKYNTDRRMVFAFNYNKEGHNFWPQREK